MHNQMERRNAQAAVILEPSFQNIAITIYMTYNF